MKKLFISPLLNNRFTGLHSFYVPCYALIDEYDAIRQNCLFVLSHLIYLTFASKLNETLSILVCLFSALKAYNICNWFLQFIWHKFFFSIFSKSKTTKNTQNLENILSDFNPDIKHIIKEEKN